MTDNTALVAQGLSFTKVIVADLPAMAEFYISVFGLKEVMRVQDAIAGQAIDEIILSPTGKMMPSSSFVLLKFVDQAPPQSSDSILGFITADLDELLRRLQASGGTITQEPRTMAELGIRVAFARDPEERLLELVQML